MGAVTVAAVKRGGIATAMKASIFDVTFSSSYGAGGDTYVNSQFDMTTIFGILPLGPAVASATTSYDVMPDLANKKLRLMGGAASGVAQAETGTAGQSTTVARVLVFGDGGNL